jgi:hypothetical protein
MTQLSRLNSALVCGPSFFAAVMLLVKGLPIGGNLIFLVVFLGSPFLWFEAFCYSQSLIYFPHSPPPSDFWSIFHFMKHPALSWIRWAGPFVVYGLVQGFIFPLRSGSLVQIAKSIAIRFLLTLLAVGLVGICLGMYAAAQDS